MRDRKSLKAVKLGKQGFHHDKEKVFELVTEGRKQKCKQQKTFPK